MISSSDNASNSLRRTAGRRSSAARRGVTLLFVVSMIVLFLLMGTAFVVVANTFNGASKQRMRRSQFELDSTPYLESAFYDLLRGTNLDNTQSPLRGHSLLGDMYGYGFSATIATSTADSSGHFLTLTLNNDATKVIDGTGYVPLPVPGALNGLVLSFVSGNARGLSSRIVDHRVSGSGGAVTHTLVVMPHWLDKPLGVTAAPGLVGGRVIVNGRPFSGTGAGQFTRADINTPALSDSALAPNQIGRSRGQWLGGSGDGYFAVSRGGSVAPNSQGPNEPYDAFDFQNMFLAGIRVDGSVVQPSFHRPELIANAPNPARADFRAFDRGGPADDGVLVDNNQDGRPEGIWMDLGFPIHTASDGRNFKPLISMTVLDMDSRINVNAHGTRLDLNRQMTEVSPLLGGTDPNQLSRGQGWGPPEIDLDTVLGSNAAAVIRGRYGADGLPGVPNVRDAWSGYKLFGLPEAPFGSAIPGTVGGHFGSCMDLYGRFAYGYWDIRDLSDGETPISGPMASVGNSGLANETVDAPYEMNFSRDPFFGPVDRGNDALYTPRELEAVLRSNDADSRLLPQRLRDAGGGALQLFANLATTDSFEVPTTHENLIGRLFRILNQSNDGSQPEGIPDSVPNRDAVIRDQLRLLAAPEFQRGLPMDVNRALGDGRDNNGNGLIDELGESDGLVHPDGSTVPFDHDNDSQLTGDTDTVFARVQYARHLMIAMLLVTERIDRNGDGATDLNDWYDFNEDGTIDQEDLVDFRRVVAQWAINAVDFRDPDATMTSFEVDLNPWNGWDVDGDIRGAEDLDEGGIQMRHVFWGAERPELLITETLATHDLRTQDLRFETTAAGESPGSVANGNDTEFDSHLVPKPTVFFELYNPWVINDANQLRAGELYDAGRNGVDLQRTSPDGSSPVWRLVVTEVDDPATGVDERKLDPDDPLNNDGQVMNTFRRIYFTRPTIDIGPEVFFPEESIRSEPVEPGLYAVVGTAGVKVDDRYDNYFGRRSTGTALESDELQDQTRRLTLDPVNGNLEIVKFNQIAGNVMTTEVRDIVTLPIGRNDSGWERDLGISDPLGGYLFVTDPANGFPVDRESIADGQKFVESFTTGSPLDYAFDEPIDSILDNQHYERFLKRDGLVPGYRVVHLQRLANPDLPYSAVTNPYRTIDSSSLDLFVFNGADSKSDPTRTVGTEDFTTLERRAESNLDPAEIAEGRHRMLFRNELRGRQTPTASVTQTRDEHILQYNLTESLGVLNQSYRDSYPVDGAGDPVQQPFGWLTWNNRPFASQLELANVPFTSSYELTRRFGVADNGRNVYQPPDTENPLTLASNLSGTFPHLLNFFADRIDGQPNGPSLHRLLDITEVPSRFMGTEVFVNPTEFVDNDQGMSRGLAPPFDRISNYRYPGKINVNTVVDTRVWDALMGTRYRDGATGVSFPEWEASRAGGTSAASVTTVGNPLRPAYAANFVPRTDLVVDPVDCGLFRRDGGDQPLFDYHPAPADQLPAADSNRAAQFRYDMRQRLGNLVTTRSSVFGVWITVGYFETNPGGGLLRGSDGGGIEWGLDSGQVRRGRAFYLIDRSIPVAFEPGRNHNVDRAVLVRSILQ